MRILMRGLQERSRGPFGTWGETGERLPQNRLRGEQASLLGDWSAARRSRIAEKGVGTFRLPGWGARAAGPGWGAHLTSHVSGGMTEGRVPAARVRGCGAAPRGGAGRRGGASGYPGGLAGKAGPGAGC